MAANKVNVVGFAEIKENGVPYTFLSSHENNERYDTVTVWSRFTEDAEIEECDTPAISVSENDAQWFKADVDRDLIPTVFRKRLPVVHADKIEDIANVVNMYLDMTGECTLPVFGILKSVEVVHNVSNRTSVWSIPGDIRFGYNALTTLRQAGSVEVMLTCGFQLSFGSTGSSPGVLITDHLGVKPIYLVRCPALKCNYVPYRHPCLFVQS